MAIEFPKDKFVNDTFPYGGMTYVWDGEKWTASGAAAFEDAYVNIDGDTMTGDLTVPNLTVDGDATVGSLNGGPLAGFRNQIINGDFRVWQRGTSFTSGGFTADRWIASGTSGSTRTVSQYDTIETTGVQVIFASGGNAGSRTMIQQKIEDVRTFAGQEVTLSFEARSTNITQISTDVQQFFGSGGSPSATTTFGGKKHTGLENAWKKFSVTFTVPSVDGKTIGTTDSLDCLQVNFFLEAGSDFDGRTDSLGTQSGNIILRNVQLEPGPVATPFEQRPIGTELALCQRYYQIGRLVWQNYASSTGGTTHSVLLPNVMRTVSATVSTSSTSGGSITTSRLMQGFGRYPSTLQLSTTSTGAGNQVATDYSIDAEL